MLNSYFYIQSGSGTLFRVYTDGKDFLCNCISSDFFGMQIHIRRYSRGQYRWLLDGSFSPIAVKALFPSWDIRRIRNLLIGGLSNG